MRWTGLLAKEGRAVKKGGVSFVQCRDCFFIGGCV